MVPQNFVDQTIIDLLRSVQPQPTVRICLPTAQPNLRFFGSFYRIGEQLRTSLMMFIKCKSCQNESLLR